MEKNLPLKDISNAPVDTSWPSTALQRKKTIMQAYILLLVNQVHHDGASCPSHSHTLIPAIIISMKRSLASPWKRKLKCWRFYIHVVEYARMNYARASIFVWKKNVMINRCNRPQWVSSHWSWQTLYFHAAQLKVKHDTQTCLVLTSICAIHNFQSGGG